MFFLSTRTEWICNFYTNLTFRSPFAALIKRAGNSNCWHTLKIKIYVTGSAIFRSFCGIPWPHVGRLISMYVSVPFSLQADNITPCLISFGDDSFPQAGEYISSFSLDVSYTEGMKAWMFYFEVLLRIVNKNILQGQTWLFSKFSLH